MTYIYNEKSAKGGFRVSTLVATSTSFIFMVILLLQLLFSAGALPLISLAFIFLTMVMLSLLIFFCNRSNNGINIYFFILFLIYYGFSYVNLIFFEDNFHRGSATLIDNLEEAVSTSYIILFFVITLCVFSISSFSNKNRFSNKRMGFLLKNPIITVRNAIFLSIFALIMHHFSFVYLGVGRYAGWVQNTELFRFIYFVFMDKDVYFILTVGLVITSWGLLGRYEKIIFLVLVISYISQALFFGSKAGLFWTLMYSMGLLLFIRGDFNIKNTVILSVGLIVILLLPLTYGVGMVFRSLQNVSEFSSEVVTVTDIIDHALGVFQNRGADIFNPEKILKSIFARINAFDSFVVIVDYGLAPDMYSHLFGGTVNILLPGTYFENSLSASRLYPVIYLESTLPEALENYHSEIYYIFGAFVPYFGVVFGLLVSIIFITILFNIYYRLCAMSSSRKVYYLSFFMYFFTWSFVYMGIEELLFMLTSGILHLFIFIFFVEFFNFNKKTNIKFFQLNFN